MDNLVKYNNDMNNVSFGKFKEKELDLFFSLCFKAKEQGTKKIKIDFSELRSLSSYQNRSLKRFVDDLDNTYNKILGLNMKKYIDEWTFIRFNLFTDYQINAKEQFITIQVHEEFSHILNNLLKNYTKFDLIDLVNLKSSYSKNMFRLLKQWESKKEKEFSLDELKDLLAIPKSYKISDIDKNILAIIRKDLSNLFPNLKITKHKTGKFVTSIEFKWTSKHPDIEIPEDKVLEISEELTKAFEKASKNRFIQPFLTEKGKSELVEAFGEEALIRGLHFAYKTIKKEFKSLLYLTRVIETGAKEQKVVIKTVKKDKFDIEVDDIQNDNIRQTSFDELPKEKKKIEVTEEEFEVLYKKYLEDNNASDSPFVRKGFAMPYSIKKENAEEK